MRLLMILTLTLGLVGMARAQDEPRTLPTTRFGVSLLKENYPQSNPKEALESVLRAIDRNRLEYLVAHLIDPDFVDQQLKTVATAYPTELRTATLKAPIEIQRLIASDATESDNLVELVAIFPDLATPAKKVALAYNPAVKDARLVLDRLRALLFEKIIADVKRKLVDDPESLKTLRRIARDGEVKTSGAKASLVDPLNPSNVVYLKLIDNRWQMENRRDQTAGDAAPAPKAAPANAPPAQDQ
ncbi:hypothetical protein [Tuwongella immobilis]|uniref:Uncharacterized protein n=1 Tax=Tuwongella immobilis TaxID=692036 RepID=A0A6C2YL54_9BACT|nr:hypothetical protein [Tuwongella immobilis]VIP02310.1 unnamed protein product [Tuwongella immobilis]VTS01016.1 unnamed protein product [Tuwongella immobilis]